MWRVLQVEIGIQERGSKRKNRCKVFHATAPPTNGIPEISDSGSVSRLPLNPVLRSEVKLQYTGNRPNHCNGGTLPRPNYP